MVISQPVLNACHPSSKLSQFCSGYAAGIIVPPAWPWWLGLPSQCPGRPGAAWSSPGALRHWPSCPPGRGFREEGKAGFLAFVSSLWAYCGTSGRQFNILGPISLCSKKQWALSPYLPFCQKLNIREELLIPWGKSCCQLKVKFEYDEILNISKPHGCCYLKPVIQSKLFGCSWIFGEQ